MIAIVDYDMANLRSVQKALEAVTGGGHEVVIVRTPEEVAGAEKLILPGVGAFKDAVRVLRERGLDRAVLNHIEKRRPFLGICLGLQMLFDTGHEDGTHAGLGLFRGDVVRFTVDEPGRGEAGLKVPLKVPHMGWNTLKTVRPSPLMKGLAGEPGVYFVHGYHVRTADAGLVATTTDYGGDFVSSIWRENVMATQFHPEKSQTVGLTMLRNFAEL